MDWGFLARPALYCDWSVGFKSKGSRFSEVHNLNWPVKTVLIVFWPLSNSSSCGVSSVIIFLMLRYFDSYFILFIYLFNFFLPFKVFLKQSFEALPIFAKVRADMAFRVNPNFLSEKEYRLIAHFSHGSVSKWVRRSLNWLDTHTQLEPLSAGCAVHKALVLILAQTFLEMLSTISNWSFQTGNATLWRKRDKITGPITSGHYPLTGDRSRGEPSNCFALSAARQKKRVISK